MGLYDRDYMREKNKRRKTPSNNIDQKLILAVIISFILGIIVCKIIL